MISYQLTDTMGENVNIGDVCIGFFPNEKIIVLGQLALSTEKVPVISYPGGCIRFYYPIMRVQKVSKDYVMDRRIPLLYGRHEFKRKEDARRWKEHFNSISDFKL